VYSVTVTLQLIEMAFSKFYKHNI